MSEGELLGNVVDVDPTLRPYYEPIDIITVGLQISKRRKSEKRNATQQLNILVSQHTAHLLQWQLPSMEKSQQYQRQYITKISNERIQMLTGPEISFNQWL